MADVLYARTMEVDYSGNDLHQDIQHVIRQVQKPRLLQDPGAVSFDLTLTHSHTPSHYSVNQTSESGDDRRWEDLFDWALWGEEQQHIGSGSESSSMPELTSATTPPPSEEGSSPLLNVREDHSKLRAKLKEAKKTDDRLTFPQRELKPKDGHSYHQHLYIHNSAHNVPTSSRQPGAGGVWLSPPPSPTSSGELKLPSNNSQFHRGKRLGPLKNGDDVADVRAMGACLPCRLRRVKCDNQAVCSNCEKQAAKSNRDARDTCCRNPFDDHNLLFPQISKKDVHRQTQASRSSSPSAIRVVYLNLMPTTRPSKPLELSLIVDGTQVDRNERSSTETCKLNLDGLPEHKSLFEWAGAHMQSAGSDDFQGALDNFLLHYIKPYAGRWQKLPQDTLAQKVYEMRCWYKIWCQKDFWCRDTHTATVRTAPAAVKTYLRNTAKSGMKRLEGDILSTLDRIVTTKGSPTESERMIVWVSIMQMLLIYRDFHELTESAAKKFKPEHACMLPCHHFCQVSAKLFSALVVICDTCFKPNKNKLAPLLVTDPGNLAINEMFGSVEVQRDIFFESLKAHPASLDRLLCVFQNIGRRRPVKRLKTSK